MILAGYNYNRRNYSTIRANGLNNRTPFSIALLDFFRFSAFFGVYHDYIGRSLAHYKPSFVKVVDILI
jgi:hypothetical protein